MHRFFRRAVIAAAILGASACAEIDQNLIQFAPLTAGLGTQLPPTENGRVGIMARTDGRDALVNQDLRAFLVTMPITGSRVVWSQGDTRTTYIVIRGKVGRCDNLHIAIVTNGRQSHYEDIGGCDENLDFRMTPTGMQATRVGTSAPFWAYPETSLTVARTHMAIGGNQRTAGGQHTLRPAAFQGPRTHAGVRAPQAPQQAPAPQQVRAPARNAMPRSQGVISALSDFRDNNPRLRRPISAGRGVVSGAVTDDGDNSDRDRATLDLR